MSSLAEVVQAIKEANELEARRKEAADKVMIANENKKFKDLNDTLKKVNDDNKTLQESLKNAIDDNEKQRIKEAIEANNTKQEQAQSNIALIEETRAARKENKDTRSDAKKNLDLNKQGLDKLRKEIEDNGGKAETNLNFQKAANKIRREELALQKQSATNPSERKEIAKEQRKAQFESIKLAFAPFTGQITNFLGVIKGIAGTSVGIPGLTLGKIAFLAVVPFIIRFLRSPAWEDLKNKLLEIDPEEATGVIGGIVKGALGVIRFIGYIGKGFGNVISLFTGNTTDENGEPVGRLKFLIDNIGSMLVAIGALGAFFAPSLLFATIRVGGKAVFGTGKWLIFKPIQAAFNNMFKSLGLLATQADDVAMKTAAIAAKGIPKGPVKGQKFKTASGKVVTFTGKAGEFVDDAGKAIKGAAGAQIAKGIQSGAVPSVDDAAANKAKLVKRYPRLKALFSGAGAKILKAVPVLGTLLTVGAGANILLSDAPRDQKVKELGALLFGTLGASGLAILGGIGGTFFGGPLGTILGSVTGAIGGYFAGDFVGRKLAGFLLGDEVTSVPPPPPTGMSPGAMGGDFLPSNSAVTQQDLETSPFAAFAMEGQQMGQSAVATASENRTDAIQESALNKVGTSPGAMGGSTALINNGGNVSSVNQKVLNQTSITHKDPIMDMVGASVAY